VLGAPQDQKIVLSPETLPVVEFHSADGVCVSFPYTCFSIHQKFITKVEAALFSGMSIIILLFDSTHVLQVSIRIYLLKYFFMTGQLTDTQIKNVLSSQALGRLACTDGKRPYIVPVTYTYDGKYIYGQTNEGLKLTILRKHPDVCFEVDLMTDMRNWQSVILFGTFQELKNKEARKARDILFDRVFPLQTSSTIHSHQHTITGKVDDSTRVKQVMYRIRIKKITGRFEKQ
jgi:uncharacterized protein